MASPSGQKPFRWISSDFAEIEAPFGSWRPTTLLVCNTDALGYVLHLPGTGQNESIGDEVYNADQFRARSRKFGQIPGSRVKPR